MGGLVRYEIEIVGEDENACRKLLAKAQDEILSRSVEDGTIPPSFDISMFYGSASVTRDQAKAAAMAAGVAESDCNDVVLERFGYGVQPDLSVLPPGWRATVAHLPAEIQTQIGLTAAEQASNASMDWVIALRARLSGMAKGNFGGTRQMRTKIMRKKSSGAKKKVAQKTSGKLETPPFVVGDFVTTDYLSSESGLVRKILGCRKDALASSGWVASADGGEPCSLCQRDFAAAIFGVDSSWFKKTKEIKPCR